MSSWGKPRKGPPAGSWEAKFLAACVVFAGFGLLFQWWFALGAAIAALILALLTGGPSYGVTL